MTNSTTVNISTSLTHSPSDPAPWTPATGEDIQRLPFGDQVFWGLPFALPTGSDAPGLVVAGNASSQVPISINIDQSASYLVLAHFCDSKPPTPHQ